jgi:hypothetical protein
MALATADSNRRAIAFEAARHADVHDFSALGRSMHRHLRGG